MSFASTDLRVVGFLLGMLCLAGVMIFVVMPFVLRFTTWFEAISLLLDGLGEYAGNRRLVWLGFVVLLLGIAGCCIVTLVITGALLTCNGSNPVQFCRLIGR